MPARRIITLALALIGSAIAIVAGAALYVRGELVDREAFVDRGVAALRTDAVRDVASEEITRALIDRASPDLLSVRPLLVSVIEALVASEPFKPVLRLAVADAHRLLLGDSARPVTVELGQAGGLLLRTLRSVSPEIAREVPAEVDATLLSIDRDDFHVQGVRLLEEARSFAGWGVGVAGLLLLVVLGIARDRRSAVATIGYAISFFSTLLILALLLAREQAIGEAGEASSLLGTVPVNEAAAAVWDGYLLDLRSSAIAAAATGLAVAAVAGGAISPGALVRRVARLAEPAVRGRSRPVRIARGVAAMAFGGLLLLDVDGLVQPLAILGGALLLLVGIEEVVDGLERASRGVATPPARRRSRVAHRLAVAAGVALVVAAPGAVLSAVLVADNPPATAADAVDERGCNGSPELCDRRLNEVAFATTHNSFSAARRPGWLFANQGHGIDRQLADGVRAFMLDPHHGVRGADGRVRTDLQADGEDRNRVARRLSPQALATADRLVERVGLGDLGGRKGLYLCHTLCELGSEPLTEELRAIAAFLERNPREIVVLIVESYVAVAELERAFRQARLFDRTARLQPGAPLPTLGEMVRADRRVVVLDERGGVGAPEWLPDAFTFVQDTPIRLTAPGRLGCPPARGDASSPLLMLNHWIDRFPPPPSVNARLGRRSVLLDRARQCLRERGLLPNLVAVDFYERTAVIEVARELNRLHGELISDAALVGG